jgi:phytoene/squalene synthetase
MKELFDVSSFKASKMVTKLYSTSFSLATWLLSPRIRKPIYGIYGFVRYADEIVDSFEGYPQEELLNEFVNEYYLAKERGISLNPIINSFIHVVKQYNIEDDLVEPFLESMRMDLSKKDYNSYEDYKKYIYGSADVVGLMCLKVFVNGDQEKYENLKPMAMSLGSAFQKVNFLRDLKDDAERLDRSYFPNVDFKNLSVREKNEIIEDINNDFKIAYDGIKRLPLDSRLGVYTAYRYYLKLLNKLQDTRASEIISSRIRVSNSMKILIMSKSFVRYKLNILASKY